MDDTAHEALAEQAEEVLAHLVALRGGAPFLSSVDGLLLVDWLHRGVPVPLILRSLEDVAERRRKKRVKTRLRLSSVKARVLKAHARDDFSLPSGGALSPITARLSTSDHPAELRAAQRLDALSGDPEELLRAALCVAREALEELWQAADRAELRRRATAELGDLADGLDERAFAELVEEVARDLLRQRHPLLSATALWDALG